jgi:hypothetical protein
VPLLDRVAEFAGRVGGLPGWAALPGAIAAGALLSAVFGLYWDISLHIDNGRDAGPLANPSHYFILAGLFGIFSAGWLAIVLPRERPGPAAVRIRDGWEAPVSGVLMMACASFAMIGFPLDDLWHRLFGQDVTLWGPTHLMMLTGAAMTLLAIMGLLVEARLAGGERRGAVPVIPVVGRFLAAPLARVLTVLTVSRVRRLRLIAATGGLLAGLSIYQGEFDFGVPQFRLLFDPVLVAFAAATALVAARSLAGPGGALAAAAFFLVIRGVLSLIVGPLFGQTLPHFPLYLVEAVLVEAVALRIRPGRIYPFALAAGALVGSLGVAAELAWSHVWRVHPWPLGMLAEAIALSLPVAVAGALMGAFLAGALRGREEMLRRRSWAAVAAAVVVVGAVVAHLLPTSVPAATARATLTDAASPGGRQAHLTVRFSPSDAVERADWLETIAWQGRGRLHVAALERVGPGVYRTTEPVPVHGSWKSGLRFHRGAEMAAFPIFLPEDPAIPAAGVPAPRSFERPLRADRLILQRERKTDVPDWLWNGAAAIVLGMTLALLGLLGWGLVRIARAGAAARARAARPPASARSPAVV